MIHRHATRRSLVAGAAAGLALPRLALAADRTAKKSTSPPKPLFTDGPLARNPLAQEFLVPDPPLVWPAKVPLRGMGKERATLESFRGKVLIVTLWAEWCVPCMVEMPGFAVLQELTRSDRFEILPILSGSHQYYKPEQAVPLLSRIGAGKLHFYMDGHADRLASTLGYQRETRGAALPCNLIIDAEGRIRGRMMGSQQVEAAQDGETGKYSVWATNIALQLARALANGALA